MREETVVDFVLSGDIGGTKIRLGLWAVAETDPRLVRDWTVLSAEVSGPVEAVERALREAGLRGLTACFGVAGPVRDGRAGLTNLPWIVDAAELETRLDLARVLLINDLEATAWAVPVIGPDRMREIKRGVPDDQGPIVILAAGTGLGQACIVPCGDGRTVVSGEGGHVDFAPRTDVEVELQAFLARRYGHVSLERVLSGPGLVDLAEFCFERSGTSFERWFEEQSDHGDRAAAVSIAALEGSSPECVAALDLFVGAFGAQSGNAALNFGAKGGVLLAGGIAPKILPAFLHGPFVERFLDKGRMRAFLEDVPVSVLLDPDAPLEGAARRAAAER